MTLFCSINKALVVKPRDPLQLRACIRAEASSLSPICSVAFSVLSTCGPQFGSRGNSQVSIRLSVRMQERDRRTAQDSFHALGAEPVIHVSMSILCMAWCIPSGRCFSSSLGMLSGPGVFPFLSETPLLNRSEEAQRQVIGKRQQPRAEHGGKGVAKTWVLYRT
ncbi:hypothetical protein ABBQ38_011743 [Trebouxia sp. C0009 RCD-2024]